ncbi:MAG: RNA polymerase sigma factor SigM [Deltaproteobacteria bacterium]|nr:MAG: RNA polymerase sigma factor SigM [Deltaproteobacteria bacterium]
MLDEQARDVSTFDRELIAGMAAGDRQAFEQVVARHAAAVFRLAKALTGDAAVAEDTMQQTFLSAYRGASTFRADASVRIWLLTIARNAAHGLDAKQSREDNVEEPLLPLGLDAGWGSEDPDAIAIAAERKGVLSKALSTLSAEDQQALILRDIEGLRGAESAKILGVSEQALKSRLHRARLRLAGALRCAAPLDSAAQEGGQ